MIMFQCKCYFFTHFTMILIVFDHANACASMRSLVEIHNTLPTLNQRLSCLYQHLTISTNLILCLSLLLKCRFYL